MMKKLLPIVALAPSWFVTAYGAPITPAEALSRVGAEAPLKVMGRSGVQPRLVHTSMTDMGEPASYLYAGADGGFLLLSADDQAYPVLGYGEENLTSEAEMAPGLKWWIESYARQINYARSKGADVNRMTPYKESSWVAIAPMVKSKWNQDSPYNDACPLLNNQRCYTGCVATAMAQVMNYFKYPEVGEGVVSYVWSGQSKKLTLNFSRQEFDWDNMLDTYYAGSYTEEQGNAVSYLMKACGYSTQMGYGTTASGTQGSYVGYAARTYFKYDGNTHYAWRDAYPTSEWTRMVYDNLLNVGPFVMDGQSPDGGHSFVCDGYDGNGYFHFNWGWGGVSDGYFALDALSPEVQGIGGYDSGFNFDQDAIFGMQPPTGEPVVTRTARIVQYGYSYGTLDGRKLSFGVRGSSSLGWGNGSDCPLEANIGAIVEPTGSTSGGKIEIKGLLGTNDVVNIPLGVYYPANRVQPNVELPELADGTYRVTLASRDLNTPDAPWEPVIVTWSYPNYVDLTVSGGKYSVADIMPPSLDVKEVELNTALYFNRYCKMTLSVENPNDIEITRTVTPVFYSGDTPVISGDPATMTVGAGSENTIELLGKLSPMYGYSLTSPTELTLMLEDSQTGYVYGEYGKYTVEPEPAKGTVAMSGCSVIGADRGEYQYGDRTYPSVFFVETGEFDYELSFSVRRGYFDGMINVGIYEENPVNNRYLIPVIESIYTDVPFMSSGDTRTLEIPVSFPDAEIGKPYYVYSQYSDGSGYSNLGQTIFVVGGSGVDTLEEDDAADVEYLNLQGVRVNAPQPGDVVIERRGSKARKIVIR